MDNFYLDGTRVGMLITLLMFIAQAFLVSSICLYIQRDKLDLKFRKVIFPVVFYGLIGFAVYLLILWTLQGLGVTEMWYFKKMITGEAHPLWFSPISVTGFMFYGGMAERVDQWLFGRRF